MEVRQVVREAEDVLPQVRQGSVGHIVRQCLLLAKAISELDESKSYHCHVCRGRLWRITHQLSPALRGSVLTNRVRTGKPERPDWLEQALFKGSI